MAVKQIPIQKLRTGMYVTKLDISWIDSPFMYHHIKVKNKGQIEKLLKAGVKNISIDTAKGIDVVEDKVTEASGDLANGSASEQKMPVKDQGEKELKQPKPSLKQEMKAARKIQGAVTKLAGEINEALKNDEAVDPAQVSPLIEGTVESLERNNQALAALINMQRKDQALANHAFGTFSLVLSLALKLELNEQERESLALAAFFHDTGWLKLPLNLIGKKKPYTASEKKLVQQHVPIGLKTLKRSCSLSPLVERLIAEHHELLDGSGYPQGIKAEKIHPLSKLFQVAVRYDELVHGMADKPAVTPNGALSQLYKDAKKHLLDEASVSALVSLLSVYPVGTAVVLSSGERAIVVETKADHPKLPVVNVHYDSSGTPHAEPKSINLSALKQGKEITISEILDLNDPGADPADLLRLE